MSIKIITRIIVQTSSESISYIYSASREKLAKRMQDGTWKYYCGNMVYKNDKSLNYILFEEGLVNKSSSVYVYEYPSSFGFDLHAKMIKAADADLQSASN